MALKEIVQNDLTLVKEDTAVVLFTASWCQSCHKLMDDIEQDPNFHVPVYNCDVDENPDLADRMHISSLPVIGLCQNQKVIGVVTGYRTPQQIARMVQSR